jgi:ankyrin repeat protein
MAAAGVNWTVAQTYTESPQALLDAIQICLDHGADVNAVNSMGVTAMIGAANRGSNDIIRFLYAQGARIDVVDKQGRSPARWAEGVFLATTGAESKPETIALLQELAAGERTAGDAAGAR